MNRLRVFMLAFLSMLFAAGAFWLLAPRRGHGMLVDAQGGRYELLPPYPPRGLAAQVLERYRRWRDPDASGLSPRDRLAWAYGLLIGAAMSGAVTVALARRGLRR